MAHFPISPIIDSVSSFLIIDKISPRMIPCVLFASKIIFSPVATYNLSFDVPMIGHFMVSQNALEIGNMIKRIVIKR